MQTGHKNTLPSPTNALLLPLRLLRSIIQAFLWMSNSKRLHYMSSKTKLCLTTARHRMSPQWNILRINIRNQSKDASHILFSTFIYYYLLSSFSPLLPSYLDVPCYLNNRQRYCSVWHKRELDSLQQIYWMNTCWKLTSTTRFIFFLWVWKVSRQPVVGLGIPHNWISRLLNCYMWLRMVWFQYFCYLQPWPHFLVIAFP